MLTDERIIEMIADRMEAEVGWSEASKVFNHYSFIDLVTHLFCEKGLRTALLNAYQTEIVNARAAELLQQGETCMDYLEWKADTATRGGT